MLTSCICEVVSFICFSVPKFIFTFKPKTLTWAGNNFDSQKPLVVFFFYTFFTYISHITFKTSQFTDIFLKTCQPICSKMTLCLLIQNNHWLAHTVQARWISSSTPFNALIYAFIFWWAPRHLRAQAHTLQHFTLIPQPTVCLTTRMQSNEQFTVIRLVSFVNYRFSKDWMLKLFKYQIPIDP